MQIGYNNDVEYRGKTFHIQTEDRGEAAASIETQIFHSGAILDTSILPYKKVLDETDDVDERIARVRMLMQVNHKKLYKRLFAGDYDHFVGLERVAEAVVIPDVDAFVPSQEAVPAAALEIERGNLDAVQMPDQGESLDLAKLKEQLARDAAAFEEEEGPQVEDSAPTMMMSLDEPGATIQMQSVKLTPPRNGAAGGVEYPKTGARAWRGCNPSAEDLDIINLVEVSAG